MPENATLPDDQLCPAAHSTISYRSQESELVAPRVFVVSGIDYLGLQHRLGFSLIVPFRTDPICLRYHQCLAHRLGEARSHSPYTIHSLS
jgi:hypothetical protein